MNQRISDSSSKGHLLSGYRIAILATDGVELSELTRGKEDLCRAGARALVVGPQPGRVVAYRDGVVSGEAIVESPLDTIDNEEFDGLFVPGGVVHADALRMVKGAVSLVRSFSHANKPIAVLGHSVSLLIEAGLAEGRDVSGAPSLKTDLVNAGARYLDCDFVYDRMVLSGRAVPAFYTALVERMAVSAAPTQSVSGFWGRVLKSASSDHLI